MEKEDIIEEGGRISEQVSEENPKLSPELKIA